jgi:hypothetical protein
MIKLPFAVQHAAAVFLGTTLVVACGNPMVQPAPDPSTVQKADRREEAPPNAWSSFRGEKFKLGDVFRVGRHPTGIDGPNVVISLVRTDWQTMQAPNGKELRTATASLVVQQGEDDRKVMINEKDDRVVFDVRIEVVAAGEDYDAEHLLYLPWVDLKVTMAAR